MIHRVYENASKSKCLDELIVATDDKRIYSHVEEFGGRVILTSKKHKSGTDRCCEIVDKIGGSFNIAINIQGDEPFINPKQIDLVAQLLNDPKAQISTLIKSLNSRDDLLNTNIPKVIINKDKEAIYFSRTPIPFLRNEQLPKWLSSHTFYKHIGIYGFKTKILKEVTKLKQSSLELAESLEQLRWIENGYRIKVALTQHESYSVDTPEDLKKIMSQRK